MQPAITYSNEKWVSEIEDGMECNPKLKAHGKGERRALSSVKQAYRIPRSDSFNFMGRRPIEACRIDLVLVTTHLVRKGEIALSYWNTKSASGSISDWREECE
jgi:hypothetical protein